MLFNLRTAKFLVDLLENKFKLLNFKFGLDPIIGLIPGIGDTLGLIISLYLVGVALQHKLPTYRIAQMGFNIALDYFLGIVPIVGDLFDFAFKSNSLNLQILRNYLEGETEVLEGEIIG